MYIPLSLLIKHSISACYFISYYVGFESKDLVFKRLSLVVLHKQFHAHERAMSELPEGGTALWGEAETKTVQVPALPSFPFADLVFYLCLFACFVHSFDYQ